MCASQMGDSQAARALPEVALKCNRPPLSGPAYTWTGNGHLGYEIETILSRCLCQLELS